MFGKQMSALQARKEALLLESDINRLRLRVELNHLRETMQLPRSLKFMLRRFSPRAWTIVGATSVMVAVGSVMVALGPLRFLLGRGYLRKALDAAPELIRLWRAFSSLSEEFRQMGR